MHTEAHDFIRRQVSQLAVLEIGSFNVNGSIRDLFPFWDFTGLDRAPGKDKGVDVVGDGATFQTPKRFDVVVSCEVFEHAENWRAIVANVATLLRPGGLFMGTAAGPGRPAHNCNGTPHDGREFYENVCPVELARALEANHFVEVAVEHRGADVRWVARKPT